MPRTIFFILGFLDPRGYSRGFLGACFLRAVRFDFLRSSLLSALVFAMYLSYSPVLIFRDVLRKFLRPLQVRVLFHQLFQSESRELYRNLGVFSFTFAPIDNSLAVFRVFHALPGTE